VVNSFAHGLPRAAVLAAWLRSWRSGLASYDEVLDSVTDPAVEETVDGLPGSVHPCSMREAVTTFAKLDPTAIRLALPAPGDPRGLPGPGPFTAAALLAGEGILCGESGLVPETTSRTSGSGDTWQIVTWHAHPVPALPSDPLTIAEAEHDLLIALRDSADALQRLDVARWRPELASALAGVRSPDHDEALPPGYAPRAHRLVVKAATVARILDVASQDAPGGAVTAWEATERDALLRPLGTAARRALMTAINAPLR
jgi:hypothetical protein